MRKKGREKRQSVKNEGLKKKGKKEYLLNKGLEYKENMKRSRRRRDGERRRYGVFTRALIIS